MHYLTRDIPPELDRALRKRARDKGISRNAATIELLMDALGCRPGVAAHHDLDWAIGRWVDDPDFDSALSAQDLLNPERHP